MRTFPAALSLLGEQRISCSSTAKYPLNTTCRTAQVLYFSVETASVRASFSSNSTVPSRTTGVLFAAGGPYTVTLKAPTTFKFSSSNTTAGVVNLAAFRYAGQP